MALEDKILSLIEKFSDEALKDINYKEMPLVGINEDLIRVVLGSNKGLFVYYAYNGGGKTTKALTLYHLARSRRLPAPVHVIYINVRTLTEYLKARGMNGGDVRRALVWALINSRSFVSPRTGAICIASTFDQPLQLGYIDNSQPLPVVLRKFMDVVKENGMEVLIILDELERASYKETPSFLGEIAQILREYFDSVGRVPVRFLVFIPKIIYLEQAIEDNIKGRREHVFVFTELREYSVTTQMIKSFIKQIEDLFNVVLEDLVDDIWAYKEFINSIYQFENGRIIFRAVKLLIAKIIDKFLKMNLSGSQYNVIESSFDISMISSSINNILKVKSYRKVSIKEIIYQVIPRFAHAIIMGRYYAITPRRAAISIWARGFEYIINQLSRRGLTCAPIKKIQNYYVFEVIRGSTIFVLWFTLSKEITNGHIEKIINFVRGRVGKTMRLQIIIFHPEETKFVLTPTHIAFKRVCLDKVVLLSIAYFGGASIAGVQEIAGPVVREFLQDIEELLR